MTRMILSNRLCCPIAVKISKLDHREKLVFHRGLHLVVLLVKNCSLNSDSAEFIGNCQQYFELFVHAQNLARNADSGNGIRVRLRRCLLHVSRGRRNGRQRYE
jgi:hypothetical protein